MVLACCLPEAVGSDVELVLALVEVPQEGWKERRQRLRQLVRDLRLQVRGLAWVGLGVG